LFEIPVYTKFGKNANHFYLAATYFARARNDSQYSVALVFKFRRMKLDRDDGETVYLEFFASVDPLRNRYQVTQQVKMVHRYMSR
jgi:hypothetical protein